MIEDFYKNKDTIQINEFTFKKKIETLLNKQVEKIKTENEKVKSYLSLRKIKNKNNIFWVKITNSFLSIDEANGNIMPHLVEGFYVSILGDDDYLHLAYNKPVKNDLLQKITNYVNNVKEISIHDFLNYLQKTMNRKADWLDKSF